MRASPVITSLNAGEFSPSLSGRSDIAKYSNSAKLLQNFLPLVQGPIMRRGGTHFVVEVKESADRTWLVKFEFSATQAWQLEFGDQYVRFCTNHGQVLSAGVPYEIVSPYLLADLTNADGTFALKFVQSGDVIYIANQTRRYAPRKLTRYSSLDWVFSTYQPQQGPLLEQNTSTTTIYASAATGSVTLTASAALFAATDVGRLVRLDSQDIAVTPWEVAKAYNINDLARFNGRTYKALNGATSGTAPPVHDQGSAYDGQTGVQWSYQDAGYGIARITAFTNTTTVTAAVVVDPLNGLIKFPANVVGGGNATKRWQLGAWSATTEYPASVTFEFDRLCWGGKQRLWLSVPNDFENMAGDFFGLTELDNAIWWQLQAEDVNDILWLSAGNGVLIIGTPGGEFIGGPITTTDAVGPSNFRTSRQSKHRCRAVQPIAIGQKLVYVQRAGRRLMSMGYKLETDSFGSTDLAVLAERMTRTGLIDMAYQSEPFSIVWCALSSGALLGFTYDQDQDVTGWHRHPIGGTGVVVESVSAIPAPDGLSDELWLIVRRTINGATKRYIEYMGRPWEGKDNDGSGGDLQSSAFYVDGGLTYDGVPADTLSGLDHLEGETVQILADGAVHPPQVVTAGAISLNAESSVVNVGLACPARMVSQDLEAGGTLGTSMGKTSRIHRASVRFIDTLGGKIGMPDEDLSQPSTLDDIDTRLPSDPMDSAPPIYTGIRDVVFPGDWDAEKRVEIVQDQPLPMTVAAIMPRLTVNDS